MIKIHTRGRLGNNIFQNVVASILSKKFDLKVEEYIRETEYKEIGCIFNREGKIYNHEEFEVDDSNFLSILKKEKIDYGLSVRGFFQKPEFVLDYKEEILSNFNLIYENPENNDLFVHVRLGDLSATNSGIEYYSKAIESIKYNKGFISSDDFGHDITKMLITKYNLTPYHGTPQSTIKFAKNFNNLVLSLSTFSWWIGFLSKAERIIYPNNIFPKPEMESINPRIWELRCTMRHLNRLFKCMKSWEEINNTNEKTLYN
jgi:hypothetical protein